ncbi:MAG: hypothetical protein ACPGLV_00025 [Bacteroidia bacterium]
MSLNALNIHDLGEKALAARRKTIHNLDHVLIEFETAFLQGRGKLHWAADDNDVFQIVNKVLQTANRTEYYIENDPIITELDLKSRLKSKANLKNSSELTQSLAYICGCAFICAESPTAYFNKKGVSNIFLDQNTLPVLIVSIDQLLLSLIDLHALAPLLCQTSNDAFELISLLKQPKLNVVIVDNGRSKLLAKTPQNKLLELSHPKYFLKNNSDARLIESIYYGHLAKNDPLSLVNNFCLDGYTKNSLLLNIDITEIVIAGRAIKAEKNKSENDLIWRSWKSAMLSRKVLRRSRLGPISLMKSFYKRGFGSLRSFPKTEKGSFSEQWVKQRPNVVHSKKLTDIPKGQLLVRKPATDGLNN